MRTNLDPLLERWINVKIIDAETAGRIRDYETERGERSGLRWPVLVAISLGGLMLAAGVVLFVASHWEALSPSERFGLMVFLVALFHVAGAFAAEGFPVLSTVLHAVGTAALGGGIFMSGQIFNLAEHWPGGLLLWSIGAWIAWAIRRDWVQAGFAAILTPCWLCGEWIVATDSNGESALRTMLAGIVLLAFTYLSSCIGGENSHTRRVLTWIGGIALLPSIGTLIFFVRVIGGPYDNASPVPFGQAMLGLTVAGVVPLALAWALRGRAAWINVVFALWVLLVALCRSPKMDTGDFSYVWHLVGIYVLCGIGSLGIVLWGLKEARRERINLGIAGFALTILFFYFAEIMDKFSRSMSLITFGLIFLLVGWSLEKTRRKLVARMKGGAL